MDKLALRTFAAAAFLSALLLFTPGAGLAQDDPYTEGSV